MEEGWREEGWREGGGMEGGKMNGGGKMKRGREDEWGEGVVLGLVAIRRPVSSPYSRGVFIVWACRRALVLCPRCPVIVMCCCCRAYIICRGRGVSWSWWLWCGVVIVWWYGRGVHGVNDDDE